MGWGGIDVLIDAHTHTRTRIHTHAKKTTGSENILYSRRMGGGLLKCYVVR